MPKQAVGRIVSLVPSATQTLLDLGLGSRLTGVGCHCPQPAGVPPRPVLVRSLLHHGLTSAAIDRAVSQAAGQGVPLYEIDLEALQAAAPDLVIAQGLCEVCAVAPEQVAKALGCLPRRPRLLTVQPGSLHEALDDVRRIGAAAGVPEAAESLARSLEQRVSRVAGAVGAARRRPRVACLEWCDPLWAAGHWMPGLVALAGGHDVLGVAAEPSRRLGWERLVAAAPQVVLVMPCGFGVERALEEAGSLADRPEWTHLPAVRAGRVFAVDGGRLYSGAGPALVDGLETLAGLVHPRLWPQVRDPGVVRPVPGPARPPEGPTAGATARLAVSALDRGPAVGRTTRAPAPRATRARAPR